MLELIEYKPEHAEEIEIAGPNEKGDDNVVLPDNWAELLSQSLVARTAVYEGRIIACGGMFLLWPGVAEAWAQYVRDVGTLHIYPRIIKDLIHQWMNEYNLVRVQAPLRADWSAGIKYAKWLGFRPDGAPEVPEGVRMRKYHYDGADAIMYSIIREET